MMLGKIAAAIIGDRMAGRGRGGMGAVAGLLAEGALKKVVPTLAAAAILVFAYKKARDFLKEELGAEESGYPSEAAPSSPSG